MLSHFLDEQAPMLESLDCRIQDSESMQLFPVLLQSSLPSLHTLLLERFYLAGSVAHTGNLINLHLRNENTQEFTSMTQLLDVLDSNPKLRWITIKHAGPTPAEETYFPRKDIHLDHLESLVLFECAVKPILSHISSPSTARLVTWHPSYCQTQG